MCAGCLKRSIKGTFPVGDKPHFLLSGASAGQDVFQKDMCCKAVDSDGNLLGAEIIDEGIPVHRNDSPALQSDNGSFTMGNILEGDCPGCTGVLPCAGVKYDYCKECHHGVHI